MSENKKRKSIFLSILKWLGYGLIFLFLFLIISLFAINEIDFLRKPFLKFATNIANNALLAKISIEDLKFTSFHSLEIKKACMIADGDTLANIENIKVNVDISPIFQSKYIIRNIELHNGTVKLLRNNYDSLWNFEKIAPPTKTVSKPSTTQPIINIKRLNFSNITFWLKDSTAIDTSSKFNPLDLFAQNLNINLSAYANLNTNKIRGNIKNISFNEQKNNFNLNSLAILFQIDSTSINIEKLNLRTSNSTINLSGNIGNYSPLSIEKYTDIEKAIFYINANIDTINSNDLLTFFDLPFNQDQVAHIKINANGNNDKLDINQFNAQIGDSQINLTGSLFNFMNDSLNYQADIQNSYITKTDLVGFIDANLSGIPDINYINIKELQATGSTRDINGKLDLLTNAGNIVGDANFQFDPDYKYYANLKFNKLNLENITASANLSSNLNGYLYLNGSGIELDKMVDTLFLSAYRSLIYRDSIDTVIVRGSLNQGIASFPQIFVRFPQPRRSFVRLNATVDFRHPNNPSYYLKGRINNVNLAAVAHDNNMPLNFSDNFELEGSGIDLDSIQFKFSTEIEELYLKNLAMLPQKIDISLKKNDNNEKEFSLLSGDNQIRAIGEIKISEFINSMEQNIQFASSYLQNYYYNFILKQNDTTLNRTLVEKFKDYQFPFCDLDLSINLNDFSLVSVFIPDLHIVSSINTDIKLNSYGSNFVADINPMEIGFTNISTNGTKIKVDPFSITSFARFHKDSIKLINPQISMDIKDISALTFNQTTIINPDLSMNYKSDTLYVDLSVNYDTLLNIHTNLIGNIEKEYFNLQIDTLSITALNRYHWQNANPLSISIDPSSINIKEFEMTRNNKETIAINGRVDTTGFDNLSLLINNINIEDYANLLSKDFQENLNDLYYKNLHLNFNADGKLNNPNYALKFGIDSIIYEKSYLGNIIGNFVYLEKKLDGKIEIGDKNKKVDVPLKIEIPKFPIDLSMENFGKIYDDFALDISMDSLQARYLGLFLPFLSNLSGIINSKIRLFGSNIDDIMLAGNLDIDNVQFNLKYNNIDYKLNSKINIDNNLVKVEKLSLNNVQYPGILDANGELILAQNRLEYFNFGVSMKNFIVLDESSKSSNMGIYGKIDISTKSGPVTIIGDLQSQEIAGALQINPSNITIVNLSQANSKAQSFFIYEIKDDKKVYTYKIIEDSTKKDTTKKAIERRLNSEKLNIDLSIFIPQKINATLQLGAIGQVNAIIGTSDPTVPLKFVLNPQNPSGQLYGDLLLEEGSTIKSYKEMKASGEISFQTGNLTNPSLNITGEYEGKVNDPQNPGKYITYIRITGTAQSPIVKFDYTINNEVPQGDSTTIQENALYLLLLGYIPGSSLNTGGGLLDPAIVNQLGNMGLSSVASRSFSDLLTKTGVIESADIQLNSQDFEQTRVQLKGKLLGNVNWTLSGNLSNFSRNNQIIIEIPFSVNSSALNQVLGQIAYSTNSNSTTIDPNEKNWEIKLKIGGSW
ncbi:MAG TPA: hypothetical protein PLC04_02150 [Candidatus Kapabacteria bacterium]|nr:hypothetical protein [Candidatus Kapabacteria bacterium]